MMCYDVNEGSFPLTLRECECIQSLCNERISEMKKDLDKKDSHKFILIKALAGKIGGFVELMHAREETENLKIKEDYNMRRELEKITKNGE